MLSIAVLVGEHFRLFSPNDPVVLMVMGCLNPTHGVLLAAAWCRMATLPLFSDDPMIFIPAVLAADMLPGVFCSNALLNKEVVRVHPVFTGRWVTATYNVLWVVTCATWTRPLAKSQWKMGVFVALILHEADLCGWVFALTGSSSILEVFKYTVEEPAL